MKKGQLAQIFGLDAEDESDAARSSDSLRVPTIDERVDIFLRAVHGDRDFTAEQKTEARARILDAMAADMATKAGISSPEDFKSELDDDVIGEPERFHEKHWGSFLAGKQFWAGTAIGALSVALITIFSPVLWGVLQERGDLTTADRYAASPSVDAQPGPGSLKLPNDKPRTVKKAAGSITKDSAAQPEVDELNQRASELYQQGRYADAELLYERVLEIKEKALGPDHLDIATSLDNLALLYWKQGRASEAEILSNRANAIREKR